MKEYGLARHVAYIENKFVQGFEGKTRRKEKTWKVYAHRREDNTKMGLEQM